MYDAAYDDHEFDEDGQPADRRTILQQYDEEIDGKKAPMFVLGEGAAVVDEVPRGEHPISPLLSAHSAQAV